MAHSLHSVLNPISCGMVYEFLYAASFPNQPEIRVDTQSA